MRWSRRALSQIIYSSFFLLVLLLPEGYALAQPDESAVATVNNLRDELLFHEPLTDTLSIEEIQGEEFLPADDLPYLSEQGIYWAKLTLSNAKARTIVFDFARIDFVDVLYKEKGRWNHLKTGYLVSGSDKQLGQWNVCSVDLKRDTEYTFYFRVENTAHVTNFNIVLYDSLEWYKSYSVKLIKDIGFLGIILIFTLYNLLVFLFSRERGYLFLGLYQLAIFVFFIFASGVLRDYLLVEYPWYTLFCILFILLAPVFYYQFMAEFLGTKKLIPKWSRVLQMVVSFDLAVFFLGLLFFAFTANYQLVSKLTQGVLMVNIGVAIVAIVLLFRQRNELVTYFIIGTLVMLVGSTYDVIFWDSKGTWGDISRIGFVAEIILFSLGLGKKIRQGENARIKAQDSYIDQLVVTEKLINRQNRELEEEVSIRTRELLKEKENAEAATRAKSEFLSVMSHEIRTPMNAIVGLTHLLMEDQKPESLKNNLQSLKYSADNLMMLINDILDYNKIESGKISLEKIKFNIVELVKRIEFVFTPKAESKGIDFSTNIDDNFSYVLKGDPARLSQIINNLLSNAIKFTHKGSVVLNIELLEQLEDSVRLMFTVRDTGIGVPEDRIEQIFDRFTQANVDTSRKYGGTGLGLAITKHLVQIMGGQIEVESKPNHGSTFRFELLMEQAGKEELADMASQKPVSLSLKGLKVLIVDDNLMNRMVLEKFLKKWGINYTSTSNGIDALEEAHKNDFDLMLLDLQMPGIDGYEVARRIREDEELSRLPIIAISADNISNVYHKVVAVGMNDFVTKPFDPEELHQKIHTYCRVRV